MKDFKTMKKVLDLQSLGSVSGGKGGPEEIEDEIQAWSTLSELCGTITLDEWSTLSRECKRLTITKKQQKAGCCGCGC